MSPYVSIEQWIPASHPLRRIRQLADQVLDRFNPTFCDVELAEGGPSVLPEQLYDNLLFRWFVGLSLDDLMGHSTTFTKNGDRLLNEQAMGRFLDKLMGAPAVKPLLSDAHFSVESPCWAAIQLCSKVSIPGRSSWACSSWNVESEGDLPKLVCTSSLSVCRCRLTAQRCDQTVAIRDGRRGKA